jgi:glycosyltransferase involved in cell wall biosynthesis
MKHFELDTRPPLVSIIVPVYNGQKFLATTLNCLVTQSFPDIEIIVVNDGSTDKTEEVVHHFFFDRRLRYFKKENGGTGSALNMGHELARGKYVTWCSADNVYFSDFIETFLKAFMQIEQQGLPVEFVYGDFAYIDANGQRLQGRDVIHKPIPKTDLVNGYDFGIAFMYTMNLWKKTGPYWNRICEDYHWAVRAMTHTNHALVNKTLAAFRVHGGQITGSRVEEEKATADECKRLARELLLGK